MRSVQTTCIVYLPGFTPRIRPEGFRRQYCAVSIRYDSNAAQIQSLVWRSCFQLAIRISPRETMYAPLPALQAPLSIGECGCCRNNVAARFSPYAFCRAVDDIADGNASIEDKRTALDCWSEDIGSLYSPHIETTQHTDFAGSQTGDTELTV